MADCCEATARLYTRELLTSYLAQKLSIVAGNPRDHLFAHMYISGQYLQSSILEMLHAGAATGSTVPNLFSNLGLH